MLYRMLTSQSLALHRSRNITGQKGWITQDQTLHGRRLGVGKQEIGQTKRHQSTEGMTHQPKRDGQLEERETLPEIMREARGIKAL